MQTINHFYPNFSEEDKEIACITLSLARYGQVYWSHSTDFENIEITEELKSRIKSTQETFDSEYSTTNLINYAIWVRIKTDPDLSKRNILVPKYGYGSINGSLYHNPIHWDNFDFKIDIPLGDFHDESHTLASRLNPNFSSPYYTDQGEIQIPQYLRSTITSHPKNNKLYTDGHILSNVTFRPYYENISEQDFEIIKAVGQEVYLSLNQKLSDQVEYSNLSYTPVTVFELATLMQQKMYEGSASMIESNLFTRGGAEGTRGRPNLDNLFYLPPEKRLEILKNLPKNYIPHHQHRNTIRNAGQIYGYYLKAVEMSKTNLTTQEKTIVKQILNQAEYLLTGSDGDKIINLFQLITQ